MTVINAEFIVCRRIAAKRIGVRVRVTVRGIKFFNVLVMIAGGIIRGEIDQSKGGMSCSRQECQSPVM